MLRTEVLKNELSNYLILADQLKAQYGEIDDETLRDTLEGISDLPQLIEEVIRSSLEDEVLIGALKARLEEMGERLSRFKTRVEKKRALACWAMTSAQLDRLQAPDFSASLRTGQSRLEVSDEQTIPGEFFIPQPARLDRAGLTGALKRGVVVTGAALTLGEPHIAVRTK